MEELRPDLEGYVYGYRQLAESLSCVQATAKRLVDTGQLPPPVGKCGRSLVFDWKEVENAIEKSFTLRNMRKKALEEASIPKGPDKKPNIVGFSELADVLGITYQAIYQADRRGRYYVQPYAHDERGRPMFCMTEALRVRKELENTHYLKLKGSGMTTLSTPPARPTPPPELADMRFAIGVDELSDYLGVARGWLTRKRNRGQIVLPSFIAKWSQGRNVFDLDAVDREIAQASPELRAELGRNYKPGSKI